MMMVGIDGGLQEDTVPNARSVGVWSGDWAALVTSMDTGSARTASDRFPPDDPVRFFLCYHACPVYAWLFP